MDTLLEQTASKITESVPKQYKKGYSQTVAAGMKLMFADQTFGEVKQYLDGITGPQDVPQIVAHGITKAMSILMNESKGRLQTESAGAAAQQLMVHALDYVEQGKQIQITPDILAATTKATVQGTMHLLQQYSGLTPEQFQQVAQGKGKDLAQSGANQPISQPPDQSGLAGQAMTGA